MLETINNTRACTTAAEFLRVHAANRPTDIALVSKPYAASTSPDLATMSFETLDQQSDSLAHGFAARGITRGTRTLMLIPPGTEFVLTWFALSKIGATIILIDPGMGGRNLRTCIADVDAEALIAVPAVHFLRLFFPSLFPSLRIRICLGRRLSLGGESFHRLLGKETARFPLPESNSTELAAIAFTTGSTGVPKGVAYSHKTIVAQIRLLQNTFSVGSEDVAFPAFLPFALFCIAMGSKTIMPSINPQKPAEADPEEMYRLLVEHSATYLFSSPAFWSPLLEHCIHQGKTLPCLKQAILFGAPMPASLHHKSKQVLSPSADTYTPYGATEALPVSSISGSEILSSTAEKSREGAGICIGRPLPDTNVQIIRISDDALAEGDVDVLGVGVIGEIIVSGDQVSREYINRPKQTERAKLQRDSVIWHRMGDLGYFDTEGRLWFCGRKNHRVRTTGGDLYSIPTESIFNQHPLIRRSALVGIGKPGSQVPIICIELKSGKTYLSEKTIEELLVLAKSHSHTKDICHFLAHRKFPVDFRHNAKIIREELQLWASYQLRHLQ